MFTGIVEELGSVVALERVGDSARLIFTGPLVSRDVAHGDSIAVNGVCLTVVDLDGDRVTVDVMRETLDRSGIGGLAPGSPVNLERSVRVDGRLGGHIVQGHVDGTGTVLRRRSSPQWDQVSIALPPGLRGYVAEKGSIAVDGVSLTVMAIGDDSFDVGLIPTTLERTTLGRAEPGAVVNLEVDVVAKYVESLVTAGLRVPEGA